MSPPSRTGTLGDVVISFPHREDGQVIQGGRLHVDQHLVGVERGAGTSRTELFEGASCSRTQTAVIVASESDIRVLASRRAESGRKLQPAGVTWLPFSHASGASLD